MLRPIRHAYYKAGEKILVKLAFNMYKNTLFELVQLTFETFFVGIIYGVGR
jgi:hypothetical protein